MTYETLSKPAKCQDFKQSRDINMESTTHFLHSYFRGSKVNHLFIPKDYQ